MSEWQPIETAPKDGKEILITQCGRVKVARWSFLNIRMFDRDTRKIVDIYGFADDGSSYDNPTHWMPLPETPK